MIEASKCKDDMIKSLDVQQERAHVHIYIFDFECNVFSRRRHGLPRSAKTKVGTTFVVGNYAR